MDTRFLATLGSIVFFGILIGLLAQVPFAVWVFVLPVLAIIGLFNNYAK